MKDFTETNTFPSGLAEKRGLQESVKALVWHYSSIFSKTQKDNRIDNRQYVAWKMLAYLQKVLACSIPGQKDYMMKMSITGK